MICKLKDLMDAKELTQTQVAESTGLSPATVGKLYRNQFERIDKETVEKLAVYLGCTSVSDLLEFVPDSRK